MAIDPLIFFFIGPCMDKSATNPLNSVTPFPCYSSHTSYGNGMGSLCEGGQTLGVPEEIPAVINQSLVKTIWIEECKNLRILTFNKNCSIAI